MNNLQETDQYWMNRALDNARQAADLGEVPVGAVIVKENQLVSDSYNLRESSNSAIAHAEILAIGRACKKLGAWRLTGCQLYVTLEPCVMCAGAIVQCRIDRLIYATKDPKGGAVQSLYSVLSDPRLNHQCEIEAGILETESANLLKDFFTELRTRQKIKKEDL